METNEKKLCTAFIVELPRNGKTGQQHGCQRPFGHREHTHLDTRSGVEWQEGSLSASQQSPASGLEIERLPVVGGERVGRSLGDFERACRVLVGEEQERPNPNNALIAVLCDAVRLSRQYAAYDRSASSQSPASGDSERLDWLEKQKRRHHAHWGSDNAGGRDIDGFSTEGPSRWRNPAVSWTVRHEIEEGTTYAFPPALDAISLRDAIDAARSASSLPSGEMIP